MMCVFRFAISKEDNFVIKFEIFFIFKLIRDVTPGSGREIRFTLNVGYTMARFNWNIKLFSIFHKNAESMSPW